MFSASTEPVIPTPIVKPLDFEVMGTVGEGNFHGGRLFANLEDLQGAPKTRIEGLAELESRLHS